MFAQQTLKRNRGIDITTVDDLTQVPEWKQFRYDVISKKVHILTEVAHSRNKQINAAVLPGSSTAKKLVQQEWNKWPLDIFFL